MKKEMKTWIWIAAVVLLTLTLLRFLLPLIFDWQLPYYSHMYYPMMFPIGIIGMIIFWGMIIYVVYTLSNQKKPSASGQVNNLDRLKQRLSAGEISIDEYQNIKRTLEDK